MTTWVFLRGLTREARHWGDFPARFRAVLDDVPGDAQPDVKIVTPDLAGNGVRCAEPSPTRIEELMQTCRQTLQSQGYSPPYHLLAMSLGGMVAVAWASQYPDECRRVVMINTSLKPHNAFFERLRPRALITVIKLMFMQDEARESEILKLTSSRADELQTVLPDWTRWAREHPVSHISALRQLLAAARFQAVQPPPVPMLFLAGANDRLANPVCSQRVAQVWHADFSLHPTAGHDLPLDDAGWVAEEVKRWLGSHDGCHSNPP